MDAEILTAAFRAHTAGQTHFTRRMAIAIALMLNETPKRVVLRCEELDLCKAGTWDWFLSNGGITPEQIAEVRGDLRRRGESSY